MDQAKDNTHDLERHRQALEESISKFRSSLVHWQKWYLEYSALKEDVVGPENHPPSRVDLARIRRDFDGELLSEEELNQIFGKRELKTLEQIVSVLSRRMDYVEQIVEMLRKQLEAAEDKLAASTAAAGPDGGTDEESQLPITDIVEELDDEDNVLNFRLQTGNDAGPKVLEALGKAGVDDLDGPSQPPQSTSGSKTIQPAEINASSQSAQAGSDNGATVKDDNNASNPRTTRAKSVSFADDTKPGYDAQQEQQQQQQQQEPRSRAARRVDQIMQTAKDQTVPTLQSAIVPDDEAPDDARLRREMLEYGMSEIAPVVAELQLDDGYSNSSGEDDDEEHDYSDEDDEDEEDEEVDDLGRSKYSVITDDYRQRMLELEKRLGVQSAFSADPLPKTQIPEEGVGRISIAGQEPGAPAPPNGAVKKKDPSKPTKKKGVRFAQELDVAPGKEATTPASVSVAEAPVKAKPEIDPLSDVVERTAAPSAQAEPSKPKKPSRFKKERGTGTGQQKTIPRLPSGPHEAPARFLDQDRPTAPSGPDGQTLANAVVEKETPAEAREPDEFDATLLHQEAAVEYHRRRNLLIQKQGGFAKQEDPPEAPVDADGDGPRPMSRFKAARLSSQ